MPPDEIRNNDPWKNRNTGMQCGTCMWCAIKTPKDPNEMVIVGRCRRHAPTMQGYPVVYMVDWCGDHKLDENKA